MREETNTIVNTATTKRCTVHYGGEKPLKIETSFRRSFIPEDEVTRINGIAVYSIDALARTKITAYFARTAARDLFDVSFIIDSYWNALSSFTQSQFQVAVAEKGLEQLDPVAKELEGDDLIDADKLLEEFLAAYDKIGVNPSPEARELVSDALAEDDDTSPTPTRVVEALVACDQEKPSAKRSFMDELTQRVSSGHPSTKASLSAKTLRALRKNDPNGGS